MKIPRGLDARTFIRALEEDGFSESRIVGSHHRYEHPDGRRVTVAYHKRSDTFPSARSNVCWRLPAGPKTIFDGSD